MITNVQFVLTRDRKALTPNNLGTMIENNEKQAQLS